MAIISHQLTAFYRFEIENGDARRRKVALQDISRHYRQGYQLSSDARNAFEKLINGMVLSDPDKKVVRWCLNALARLGRRQSCGEYVQIALKKYADDPEIVAAGVAALSHMYGGDIEAIPELASIDPAICILAAMQTTDPSRIDTSKLKIDIDKSDVEVLKLALLTIGLNRDIQNLLHPNHSNGALVKKLCQHDDKIVQQYSVWSVTENKHLTMADLGISFGDIEKQPPNVQSKLFQLIAERELDVNVRLEIIGQGAYNQYSEARLGLAAGIKKTFFSGLEGVTIDWFDNEIDPDVREGIAEHFAIFSDACPVYFEKAIKIFESEPRLEERLLLGAEGKRLYGELRRQTSRAASGGLFGSGGGWQDGMLITPQIVKVEIMKVLFLAASPTDQQPLKLDVEARDIREQIQLVRSPKIEVSIDHVWAVRTDQIQKEILNIKPDILHFSGHGGNKSLVFENSSGGSAAVSGKALAGLVGLMPSIRYVILNACYSDSIAQLMKGAVEAVIGCDDSIADSAAADFSRAFYRALAHGENVVQAFHLAKNEVALSGMDIEAEKFKLIV